MTRPAMSRIGIAVAISLAMHGTAWAEEGPDLGAYGKTELQRTTGDSVQNTCLDFIANGANNPNEQKLFDTCTAMVVTSLELDTGQAVDGSLGLNSDQLGNALQQIATEEFAATEAMANELSNNRLNAAITRLSDLRRGARGISISGLLPEDGAALGGAAGDAPLDMGGLGIFINGAIGTGSRDATERSDEFDYDSYNINFGVDYRFSDNLVLGAALNYYDMNSDFATSATVSGGGIDSDGWGGFLYGSYYGDNFYVDGLAGYASSDYSVVRSILIPSNTNVPGINETAVANPESDDITWSLGAGYQFNSGNLTYGPFARLTYTDVDVDGYRESGATESGLALSVESQSWKSLTSVLGARFSASSNQSFGVLSPQARLAWVHEFENDSKLINATYVYDPRNNILSARTDDPDRDYFELGVSLVAVLRDGAQLYASYDTVLGLENLESHVFTLGGRWELD